MAHLNLGLVHALVGQKEEAIEVYRRCSQLDGAGLKDPRTHETTKISALFNLGRLYADDANYLTAIDIYHEAIQRMPAHYQPQVHHSTRAGVFIQHRSDVEGVGGEGEHHAEMDN